MPKNLTDVSTFTDPIVVPVGTDPRTAASVELAAQGLANRTRQAVTAVERTFVVSPHQAQFTGGWSRGNLSLDSTANAAVLYLHLDFLPHGSVLKRVRALVNPGSSNTMSMDIRYRVLDFAGPSEGTDTGVELGLVTSGTAVQALTTTLLSETIDRVGGKNYVAVITASSSGGSSPDTLWGFQIVADIAGIGAF